MTQKHIQVAYVLYWDKEHCFFFGHTWANKVYPDPTAPEELSDQGILYLPICDPIRNISFDQVQKLCNLNDLLWQFS